MAGSTLVFDPRQHRAAEEREAEPDRLYQQMGKLQVVVAWLKKNRVNCPEPGGQARGG